MCIVLSIGMEYMITYYTHIICLILKCYNLENAIPILRFLDFFYFFFYLFPFPSIFVKNFMYAYLCNRNDFKRMRFLWRQSI